MAAAKTTLTQKDLSLLSDLMTYEQWAAKKSQAYSKSLTDPVLQGMCRTLEENHNKNFSELYNFLKAH